MHYSGRCRILGPSHFAIGGTPYWYLGIHGTLARLATLRLDGPMSTCVCPFPSTGTSTGHHTTSTTLHYLSRPTTDLSYHTYCMPAGTISPTDKIESRLLRFQKVDVDLPVDLPLLNGDGAWFPKHNREYIPPTHALEL